TYFPPAAAVPGPHLQGCPRPAKHEQVAVPSFFLSGQARGAETEFFDRLHHRKIVIQISRLADIAVRAEFVTARYIQHRARGAEYHDWDGAKFRVTFGLRQYRPPIFLRQIQIQDHQVGTNRIGILADAMQKGHGLLAVRYIADAALMPAHRQRLPRKTDVGRVVVHEKDLRQLIHRPGFPLPIVTTGRQSELESETAAFLKLRPSLPSKCSVNASGSLR